MISPTISTAETIELNCYECQVPFIAEVWLLIHASERTDLIGRVMAETIHKVTCTNGHTTEIDAPLLLFMSDAESPLLFSPAQGTNAEQDREHAQSLVSLLRSRLGLAWTETWLRQGLRSVARPSLAKTVVATTLADLGIEARSLADMAAPPAELSEQSTVHPEQQGDVNHVAAALKQLPPDERDAVIKLIEQLSDNPDALAVAISIDYPTIHAAGLADELQARGASIPHAFRDDLQRAKAAEYYYCLKGDLGALNESIEIWERIVTHRDFSAVPNAFRSFSLGNAAEMRLRRRRLSGHEDDLNSAISRFYEALLFASPESRDRPQILNNLACCLSDRYECTGELADLEEAIKCARKSVAHTPTNSTSRVLHIVSLGNVVLSRYKHSGELADLEESITSFRKAVAESTSRTPEQATAFDSLGAGLNERYTRTGEINDLEEAIKFSREAVARTSADSVDRPRFLINLSNGLGARFHRDNKMADLEEGIESCRLAIACTPESCPKRPFRLNHLSYWLQLRYNLTGELKDFEEAVDAIRSGIALAPAGSSAQASCFNTLGHIFRVRHGRTNSHSDLDEAITAFREAVAFTPANAQDRARFLKELADGLNLRYGLTGKTSDLEEAIYHWKRARVILHEAIFVAPETGTLSVHASELTRRLVLAHLDQNNPEAALKVLEEGKAVALRRELRRTHRRPANLTEEQAIEYERHVDTLRRIGSSRRELNSSLFSPEQRDASNSGLSQQFRTAVDSLNELESLDDHFKFPDIDYPRLCAAAANGEFALIFIHPTDEAKRGTISFIVHPGSSPGKFDPDDMISHPDLSHHELHRILFQSPPGLSFDLAHCSELINAAAAGEPFGWIAAYWLTQMTRHSVMDRAAHALFTTTMTRLLAQLSEALRPLLDRLNSLSVKRCIFLPSAGLAVVPFHALSLPSEAGDEFLGDRFVVSYAPSAAVLLRAMQRETSIRLEEAATFVAVANPDGSLIFADDEVESISKYFHPECTKVRYGAEARLEWLLDEAPHADYLKLSTHGNFVLHDSARSSFLLSHPGGLTVSQWMFSPSTMHLPLADFHNGCERLTLSAVWGGALRLRPGCVVSADACETAQIDQGAIDEEFYGFPAAFLAVGARSVLASLWSVNDQSTALIMDHCYKLMMPPHCLSPASALQSAAQWLRQMSRENALQLLADRIERTRKEMELSTWDTLTEATRVKHLYRLSALEDRLHLLEQQEKAPFEHPYYWAAFVSHGA